MFVIEHQQHVYNYNSLYKNHNIPEMSLFPSSGGEEEFVLCWIPW